jgi:ABC-2 type transport system permease protein
MSRSIGASGASRILALLAKDFAELRHAPGIFVPPLLTGAVSVLYPFVIAVIVPYFAGERLSDSSDFDVALEMYRVQPAARALSAEGAIQAMIFQFALTLMVGLTTVTGGMSIAAHSIVGEKQARSLEPLLATPLRTSELLVAKILSAIVPGSLLTAGYFAVYLAAVAAFAEPGVWAVLLTGRSLALVFVLGPLAALVGLQIAVCASSRASDARSAQQLGAMVIVVPLVALQISQVLGGIIIDAPVITVVGLGLAAANGFLFLIAVAIFDRESILTRWK